MEKTFRLFAAVMLALGITSALGIAWNLYQVNEHIGILYEGSLEGYSVMGVYLFVLVFHAGSFAVILRHTFLSRTLGALKIATSVTGIVSFFSIAVQKVMFDEIAREGSASGELTIINICLVINMFFIVAMLALLVRTLHENLGTPVTPAEAEDIFFVTGHALGAVAGLLGIFVTLSLIVRQVPADRLWTYLPFYAMILAPYLLAAAAWGLIRLGSRAAVWYDEKQWRDMLGSSFATMILAAPTLALLFVLGKPTGYYWFPWHLFLTLLLFSAGTLVNYKRG